jgi:hypothetical protein
VTATTRFAEKEEVVEMGEPTARDLKRKVLGLVPAEVGVGRPEAHAENDDTGDDHADKCLKVVPSSEETASRLAHD